jgi:carboxylesterase
VPEGPTDAERAFEAAAAQSKTLRKAPDNDTLLMLYALYKQGTSGDVTGARPGVMDVVGRAKYDAWSAKRGVAREAAMSDYVSLVNKLKAAEAQVA